MNPTKLTKLERKVLGNNKINKLTIKAVKNLLPQLQEFLGKKVKLRDGGKANKLSKIKLLEVPLNKEIGMQYRTSLQISFTNIYLWNDITIKDNEFDSGGYSVCYYTKKVDLGNVKDGILTNLNTLNSIVKNYELDKVHNAKKIQKALNKIEALKGEISELQKQVL